MKHPDFGRTTGVDQASIRIRLFMAVALQSSVASISARPDLYTTILEMQFGLVAAGSTRAGRMDLLGPH